jgi:spore coat protein CotH
MRHWLVVLFLAASFVGVPASGARAQTTDDFFNGDTLQRIDLLMNSRDWAALKANFRQNDYYPADMHWQGQTIRNLGIRSRGGGSRNGTKPGLRVDINRYESDQTFLGLSSFILDNMTQDASGMHERIAMRLFAMMGIAAPREAHVQLFVNNEYAGLYAIVESIDKSFLRRVFGNNATGVENDGYLFEYKYTNPWYFEYLGSSLDPYAALLNPVTHENASTFTLYDPVEQMIRAINSGADDQFMSTVGVYIDLPLFMRYVAVQSVIAEWDGTLGYAGVNNFYLYRFEHSTRSQWIPWDEDNAFRAVDYPILPGVELNVLVRRAMNVPELRAAFINGLLDAIALASATDVAGGAGWLEREVLFEQSLISVWMRADTAKPFTNEEFEAGVDAMLVFARSRSAFVRCEAGKLTGSQPPTTVCTIP